MNLIKSKYQGLENYLDENFSRRNGGVSKLNSTARTTIKRSWLNQSVNVHSESGGGNTTRFMNEMINKSIDITLFEKDTTNAATTSRDRGYVTASG